MRELALIRAAVDGHQDAGDDVEAKGDRGQSRRQSDRKRWKYDGE